jgi:NADH-quinone oxidoreductase subunit E
VSFAPDVLARLEVDAKEIIGRYPRSRSALLPLLHLVQAEEGFVSPHGIEFCAEQLDLTAAEVAAVATFYTMYKRRPNGEYSVGVCTNTLCAVMGGDQIFATLKEHLGVGHDETTEDGKVTLEHLECNAACDYAPVMMVNWEFFDNQTPESAVALVDDLRAGKVPTPTRGASLCTFKEVSRVLAGFYDGRANEGPAAGKATLAGLEIYREQTSAGKRRKRDGADEPTRSTDAANPTPPSGEDDQT